MNADPQTENLENLLLRTISSNKKKLCKELGVSLPAFDRVTRAKSGKPQYRTFTKLGESLQRLLSENDKTSALGLLEARANECGVSWVRPSATTSADPSSTAGDPLKGRTSMDEIRVIGDPAVVKAQIGDPDPKWLGRLKYVGFHGAFNWVRWESCEDYRPDKAKNIEAVSGLCLGLLQGVSPAKTFVSLGPGSGELDKALFLGLSNSPSYLPVDISDALLGFAWSSLKAAGAKIPICVLGDFEEGLDFILKRVSDFGVRPILFALLGNTFGNFEKSTETTFLSHMKTFMNEGDLLLLHVGVYGDNYQMEKDHRYGFENMDEYCKLFMAYALARKGQSVDSLPAEMHSPDHLACEIAKQIEEYIGFDAQARSAVPNTKSFAYIAKKLGNKPVQIIHRYDLNSLVAWLREKGWQVTASEPMLLKTESDVYDAVLLLKKPSTVLGSP